MPSPAASPARTSLPSPDAVTTRRAHQATFAVFVLSGTAMATWASRLPDIRRSLGLTPGQLGLLLLVIAVGSVVSLPTAGAIAARLGTARATVLGAALQTGGLTWAGIATTALHSVAAAPVGLVAIGVGAGLWDVSMNLEGAEVERRAGRAIMPALHAGFSLGTVVAAGLGALCAFASVPVWAHLAGVAALALTCVLVCVRRYLPVPPASRERTGAPGERTASGPVQRPRSAWLEPRTLMIGVLVLSAAFTEGTANDWLSIAAVDGYGLSTALGAVALGLFLAAMTTFRLLGQRSLDRWGRVPTVAVSTLLGGVGVVLLVVGPLPVAVAGTVLWGAGAALGFPVGISAAADVPERAAARVAVVTTIGYTAFLAGPPVLGFLGDHVGVRHALLAVAVVAVPSLLLSRVLSPARARTDTDTDTDTQAPSTVGG